MLLARRIHHFSHQFLRCLVERVPNDLPCAGLRLVVLPVDGGSGRQLHVASKERKESPYEYLPPRDLGMYLGTYLRYGSEWRYPNQVILLSVGNDNASSSLRGLDVSDRDVASGLAVIHVRLGLSRPLTNYH